jgi:prepilin-type N-terminal cleavage/methylation domain-containing protein
MKKGFTLAELLIVIVIIAIMASFVLPRFFGQVEKSNTAEATQMLGVIHRALLQYADAHGKNFPDFAIDNTDVTGRTAFQNTLGIDVQESKLWTYHANTDGSATAVRSGTETHPTGNLTLAEDGTWTGESDYAEGAAHWPFK